MQGLGQSVPPSAAAVPEASVKPGINTEFLKPEVDVEQWIERFEREGREIYVHRERIAAVTGVRPGQHVADIGAGSGLFTLLFAEKVGSEGRVVAVDIVPAFLERIRQRAADAGRQNVQTVLATERSSELPPASVDLAFICDTYHHFEYPQQTLASIHRALKPDGELVLVEFKRIPGESSEWILNHVRAGEEVFTREIEEAGFRKIGREDFLKENYLLRFRRVERSRN
jgi:ubiquinone/menaquinone biosynthesis C-methylase UbiE